MKIKIIKFKHIYLFTIVLLSVILTGNPMAAIYYSTLTVVWFLLVIIGFWKHSVLLRKPTQYIFLLCGFAIISAIINSDRDITHYIGNVITHISALCVISIIEEKVYKKIYLNIIVVVSLYSILITLYINFFNINALFSMPQFRAEGIGNWRTWGFLYNAWETNKWTTFIRNSGFFREPGVMALHTNLATILLLENVNSNHSLNRMEFCKFLILIISGLMTLSTVGVLTTFLEVFLYIVKLNRLKTKHLVMLLMVSVVGLYFLMYFSDILFKKLISSNLEYVSVTDRTTGIISALDIALRNPIFGAGYYNYHKTASSIVTFYFVDLWGKYGIFYSLLVTYGIYNFLKRESHGLMDFLIVFIIIAASLVSQGFADYPVFILLELYSLDRLSWRKELVDAVFYNSGEL